MDAVVRDRWLALAAVAAALAAAIPTIAQLARLTPWWPDGDRAFLVVAGLLGIAGAVLTLVAAVRRRDRAVSAFAIAVLALSVPFVLPVAVSDVGTILVLLARALMVAFGVLVAVRARGRDRVLGWVVAIAAAFWIVSELSFGFFLSPTISQAVLSVVVSLPGIAEVVAFLAAAAFFLPPLLRPVGDGARALWSSADVR